MFSSIFKTLWDFRIVSKNYLVHFQLRGLTSSHLATHRESLVWQSNLQLIFCPVNLLQKHLTIFSKNTFLFSVGPLRRSQIGQRKVHDKDPGGVRRRLQGEDSGVRRRHHLPILHRDDVMRPRVRRPVTSVSSRTEASDLSELRPRPLIEIGGWKKIEERGWRTLSC